MSTDNIKVAVRVRPPIKNENFEEFMTNWNIDNNNIYQIDKNGEKIGEQYSFDRIYHIDQTNTDIYRDVVDTFVNSSLKGVNSTIFAYGQTSSGKTHTMLGDLTNPGIMSQAIENIFRFIKQCKKRQYLIRVSYVEIYNENFYDLLQTSAKDIKIRETIEGNIILQGVIEELIATPQQAFDILKIGSQNRKTGSTKLNERSSRSHTIFRINIHSTEINDCESKGRSIQTSNLNFVDLAGSERVAQTKATGIRFVEGTHINKSLSVLGFVIRQLSDGCDFINFRDSKLTRLLQHSLGGNAKTLIIATVTLQYIEDSHSTLSFARRAKTVKNKPTVNEKLTDQDLIKRYSVEVNQYKKELERIKNENSLKIYCLQEKVQLLQLFQNGNQVEDKQIPKRRHTIGVHGIKPKSTLNTINEEFSTDETLDESLKNTEEMNTSAKSDTSETESPLNTSTPKLVLRTRMRLLETEYNELELFSRDEQKIHKDLESELQLLSSSFVALDNQFKASKQELNELNIIIKKNEQIMATARVQCAEQEFTIDLIKQRAAKRENELLEKISRLENELKSQIESNKVVYYNDKFGLKKCKSDSDIVSSITVKDYQYLTSNLNNLKNILNEQFDDKLENIEINNFCKELGDFKESLNDQILFFVKCNFTESHINIVKQFNEKFIELTKQFSYYSVEFYNTGYECLLKKELIDDLKYLIDILNNIHQKNIDIQSSKIDTDDLINQQKNHIDLLDEEIKKYTEKLEQYEDKDIEYNLMAEDLKLLENLKFENNQLSDETTALKDQIYEMKKITTKTNDEYLKTIETKNELISKLEYELNNIKLTTKDTILALSKEVNHLTEKLENDKNKHEHDLIEKNIEIISLKNEIENCRHLQDECELNKIQCLTSLKHENFLLKNDNERLDEIKKKLTKEVHEISAKYNNETSNLTRKIIELEHDFKQAKIRENSYKEEVLLLNSKFDELLNKNNKIIKHNKELHTLKINNAVEIMKLTESIEEYKNKLSEEIDNKLKLQKEINDKKINNESETNISDDNKKVIEKFSFTTYNLLNELLKQQKFLINNNLDEVYSADLRIQFKNNVKYLEDELQKFQQQNDWKEIVNILEKCINISLNCCKNVSLELHTKIEDFVLKQKLNETELSQYKNELNKFQEVKTSSECKDCVRLMSKIRTMEIGGANLHTRLRYLNKVLMDRDILIDSLRKKNKEAEQLLQTTKYRTLQINCSKCYELTQKIEKIEKEKFETSKEIIKLKEKLYELEKDDKPSNAVQFYQDLCENLKVKIKQLEKASIKPMQTTVEVQCNLFDVQVEKVLSKYDITKRLCEYRNTELIRLRTELDRHSKSTKTQEVQCDILNYNELITKYQQTKKIAQIRGAEIAELKAKSNK